jgi:hypothetical protein
MGEAWRNLTKRGARKILRFQLAQRVKTQALTADSILSGLRAIRETRKSWADLVKGGYDTRWIAEEVRLQLHNRSRAHGSFDEEQ